MRQLMSAVVLLGMLDASVVTAQTTGSTPPTPPPPASSTRAPSAPAPAARPPRPSSAAAASPRALIDREAIEDEVRAGLAAARAFAPSLTAPRALADLDVNLSGLATTLSSFGQQAGFEAARAAMDGQRAAMVGARAAMDGQRAAMEAQMEAQVAASIDGALRYAPSVNVSGLTFAGSGSMRTQAPAPWKSDDPADSLYREARKALASDAYGRAVELFQRIRNEYPKSVYAPDAGYWQAFALQRQGGQNNLTAALSLLEQQQEKYPRASTRSDAQSLRTRVEGQLARLGDQNAIAALADRARNASSDGCPREQDDERIDALNAVAQMDAEKAMPILKKVLTRREACTKNLRRTAVWLVASRKQPEAADILLNVAKTDPDKDVREQAVFWMANVPTEEATTMLIDLAKKSDDIDLQKKAVYALSRSKSPRAVAVIKELALDPKADVDLRGDALNWYMSGPGRTADDALPFLKDVFGRADDPRFKQRVLQTIAMRRTDESRTFLVEVAQNSRESLEVRRNAIWALQGSGITNTQLAQIYDRGTELEIRRQVIGVLGSLKDNGGIDKLLDIGRNEKNVELRKTAITYLTRSKDPRALELLQEIINK